MTQECEVAVRGHVKVAGQTGRVILAQGARAGNQCETLPACFVSLHVHTI